MQQIKNMYLKVEVQYGKQNVMRTSLLFVSLLFLLAGTVFNNFFLLIIAIFGVLAHNLWYACESIYQRSVFFFFNSTFFVFLLARFPVKIFTNYIDPYNDNQYGLDFPDASVQKTIFITLFLSLLFLFLGYKLIKEDKMILNFDSTASWTKVVSNISKMLFYITLPFSIIILGEKSQFTSIEGYHALYSTYDSIFPFWFEKVASMNTPAFFMYLATMPNLKREYLPILLYVILGTMSLIVGQRSNFILNILIICIYLSLRASLNKGKKPINRKIVAGIFLMVPLLVIGLNAIAYFRVDEVREGNLLDSIYNFFYSQGVSINLIGYAQTLDFPDGKYYSVGRLLDFINNNALSQLLFDFPSYRYQTIESATIGNSFSDAVSYILSPNAYLGGWGYGSSYVAELLKDGHYIGVILGNTVMGIILALQNRLFRLNIVTAAVSLMMIRLLMYASRDTFLSFFVTSLSLINLLTIFIIILVSFIIYHFKLNEKFTQVMSDKLSIR